MIWRHYKGGEYDFIGVALVEATLRPVVVYKSVKDGTIWTRPAEEFFGEVEVVQPAPAPPMRVPRFIATGHQH